MRIIYTLHSDGRVTQDAPPSGRESADVLRPYLAPCERARALFDDRTLLDVNTHTLNDLVTLLDACAGQWQGYYPLALVL